MKEVIEIKRKEFEVIEKIGARSYKVERKGKIYFLKKFEGDKEGFETTIKNQEIIKNCGITVPKIYLWDKNSMIFVTDYIEGKNCFDELCEKDLDEGVIECIFNTYWYCKKNRYAVDFDPSNFIYNNDKLYYIPFKVSNFDSKRDFLTRDLPFWFFTKDFVNFARSKKVDVDTNRLLSDFEINKIMTLMSIKYYR